MCVENIPGYDFPINLWQKSENIEGSNSTTIPPPIDMRSLVYLSPIKSLDHISCPICKLPFIEPWSTVCGHTFCKDCLFESLKSPLGERCPLDRVSLKLSNKLRRQMGLRDYGFDDTVIDLQTEDLIEEEYMIDAKDKSKDNDIYPAPIIISNMTDDLEVQCLNKDRGCNWTGERWRIKKHLVDDCEFTKVLCKCGEPCDRKSLLEVGLLTKSSDGPFEINSNPYEFNNPHVKIPAANDDDDDDDDSAADDKFVEKSGNSDQSHNFICPHTTVQCVKCESNILLMDIKFHLQRECTKNLTTCSGCHLQFPLMHLDTHQKHCQELYIDCPGAKYGCTWKGQREVLKEVHEADCTFIKMASYLEKLENNICSINKENDSLKIQMSSILNSVVNGNVHNLGYPLELEEVDGGDITEGTNEHQTSDVEIIEEPPFFPLRQRISMSKVKTLVKELEINKNVTKVLLDDNVNMREQLNGQHAMLMNLQQQIQFMLIERRRKNNTFSNTIGQEAKF